LHADMNYTAIILALCLAAASVDGQFRGGRRQAPRRGRDDGAAAGYAGPDDVPVYGAASDAVPVYNGAGDDPLAALEGSIPGVPGEDYPIYAEVPQTGFICDDKIDGGYYADPEAECQAFHICTADGQGGLAKYSFLCPNGTILNQNYLICDWWFNFDCTEAEAIAEEVNAALAEERAAASGDQAAYSAPVQSDYSAAAPANDYSSAVPAYDDYSSVSAADDYAGAVPPPSDDYLDAAGDVAPPADGYAAADSALDGYEAAERAARRLGNRRNGRRGGRRSGRRGFSG